MAETRNIVRIVDTDLNGETTIEKSLTKVKGINERLAKTIAQIFYKKAKVKDGTFLGDIDPKQDEVLSQIIREPIKNGVPKFMINRSYDVYSGEDRHVVGPDLDFALREDKQRLGKIKTRRGLRLAIGLPVRGQRTKSNYRRKGGVVGVAKKK